MGESTAHRITQIAETGSPTAELSCFSQKVAFKGVPGERCYQFEVQIARKRNLSCIRRSSPMLDPPLNATFWLFLDSLDVGELDCGDPSINPPPATSPR